MNGAVMEIMSSREGEGCEQAGSGREVSTTNPAGETGEQEPKGEEQKQKGEEPGAIFTGINRLAFRHQWRLREQEKWKERNKKSGRSKLNANKSNSSGSNGIRTHGTSNLTISSLTKTSKRRPTKRKASPPIDYDPLIIR